MKNILKLGLLVFITALSASSCKKGGEIVYATAPGSVGALTASALKTAVLQLSTKEEPVTTFNWAPVSYGANTRVNYMLQFDSAGKGFTAPFETTISGNNSSEFILTQAMLNSYAIQSGIAAGSKGSVEFRIKTTIGNGGLPVYSAPMTLTYTTYDEIVFWYVPGDYQGWNPATAPRLGSTNFEDYSGYVYAMPSGYPKFKITTDPDWNHTAYGDGGGGILSATGGDIAWPAPMPGAASVFYITTKKSTLEYSITPAKFTIAGDFNGWSSSANELTYDKSNIYTFTTNFTPGGFKIVINGGTWCGSDGTGALIINGGENIPVTAGVHTVSVDMSAPPRYKVSIQ